jgi:ataxia telangiectasia mutated family protein
VDHIIQTLPKADGEYCEPIAQHYLKALSAIFKHTANVERLKTEKWLELVDFCLQGVNQYLHDNDGEASGLSRSFSSLGSNHFSGSVPKSVVGNGRAHIQNGSISRQNAEDLLQTLLSLVSASNAPLAKRYQAVADCTMRFLVSQSSTVSQLHQVAFSIVNAVLFFTRVDHTAFSQSIANDAVPIIWRFWQGKNVAKDEMLSSVRDEMLTLLLIIHPHLERSLKDGDTSDLLSKLEDLLDVLRADYARRLDRDQIQLDDLEMEDLGAKPIETIPFRLYAFRLKPFNIRAERNWANLLIIGILERLVNIGDEKRKLATDIEEPDGDRHPRKRQRTSQSLDKVLDPLKSTDENVRMAGLQMVPFVLQEYQLSPSALTALLHELHNCASDKRGNIASWALLAIARQACLSSDADRQLMSPM